MSNSKAISVQIEGNQYVTLEYRYPAFLEKFPAENYAIVTDYEPFVQRIHPFIDDKKRLESGPTDVPIHDSQALNMWIFRATLIRLSDDKIIRTAHALNGISDDKSFERLETAAIQRLVASCGFASGVFLSNELTDILSKTKPNASVTTAVTAVGSPADKQSQQIPSSPASSSSTLPPAAKPSSKPSSAPATTSVRAKQLAMNTTRLNKEGFDIKPDFAGDDNARMTLVVQALDAIIKARNTGCELQLPDGVIGVQPSLMEAS